MARECRKQTRQRSKRHRLLEVNNDEINFVQNCLFMFCLLVFISRLHLRVRFLTNDLNEVKFKDPITFNYYYEQTKNDFMQFIAPSLNDAELMPSLLDLGCLEIR